MVSSTSLKSSGFCFGSSCGHFHEGAKVCGESEIGHWLLHYDLYHKELMRLAPNVEVDDLLERA
jgi:hypothetical protein